MLRASRNLGRLAEELHDDWPTLREELQQVAAEARSTFSRVEVAATVAVVTLVVTALVAVTALIVSTVAVVSTHNSHPQTRGN